MIMFPTTAGITGEVFRTQTTLAFNNFTRNNNILFVEDVDNIDSLAVINNIVMCPMTREDGTTNGVLQFYNSPMPITSEMKNKIHAIGRFLGACIQNLEDKLVKVTT